MPDFRWEALQDSSSLGAATVFKELDVTPVQDQDQDQDQMEAQARMEAQYTPYKAQSIDATIRLISLQPGLSNTGIEVFISQASLSNPPEYEALSYVWGDQHRTAAIKCNGCDLAITASLRLALEHLRLTDKARTLWIDAVCIDQDNPMEKQQQVLLMGSIFLLARNVVIWLGVESVEDQEALNFAKRLYPVLMQVEMKHRDGTDRSGRQNDMRSAICDGPSSQQELRHLFQLLDRPWFHRIWTVQEFAKATKPLMLCGKASVLANDFTSVAFRVRWQMDAVAALLELDQPTRSEFAVRIDNCTHIHALRFNGAGGQKEPTMHSLLSMTRRRQCTDSKDRLYSLLSLVSPQERTLILPEYLPGLEYLDVLKKFTFASFTELQSLEYLQPFCSNLGDTEAPHFPSWLADPCTPSTDGSLSSDDRLYRAAGDTKASLHVSDDSLFVLGKQVDSIAEASAVCLYEPLDTAFGGATSLPPVLDWLRDSHNLAFGDLNGVVDMHQIAARGAAYTRTLMLECQPSWAILLRPDEIPALYEILQRLLTAAETNVGERTGPKSLTPEDLSLDGEEVELISGLSKCFGRRFCLTSGKRFAAAPSTVEKGDIICVLRGHGIPQLLRKDSDGAHRLIGGCYVDGFMHGEAMIPDIFEDQIFEIQ